MQQFSDTVCDILEYKLLVLKVQNCYCNGFMILFCLF